MKPTPHELFTQAAAACERLGLGPLRPKQAEVLAHLARGAPVFAALPTGYGKSLCAWMPAFAWGWRVWVLSPLVSLIEDQALACRALGISCVAFGGGLTKAERRQLEERLERGDWQVAFLSPERFVRWSESGYLAALERFPCGPDLFVLDEMHCLEEWRTFRAGYRGLTEPLRRRVLAGAGFLGLSASLPEAASRAWMEELGAGETCARVEAGLGRENIALRVVPVETEPERWLLLVAALRDLRAPASALVYCWSRGETDDVARWLRSVGFPAVAYHAGLPPEERRERSIAFRSGRLRIICATSAFGMGIDYPHVDRVIHFSCPRDLESYWQEVGRAGRGGQPCEAIAFWRRSEVARARLLEPRAREGYFALWEAWAEGGCRKAAVAGRLGLEREACGKCDRCEAARATGSLLGPEWPAPWWISPAARFPDWVRSRREAGVVMSSDLCELEA